ncbi:phage terminase small subunit P27 family [Acinetobacter sp. C_4_1]|uniref:phage terminase small subunit P27 family n=1 Tax=unclassified Acinetobacter TaxID=196816 RepID=UPI0021B80C05|nr:MULTISPECIES: phage terminase small subunit P27 family [unclassified Acinetobacter]MCT8090708.1 phage terminase small subunit P27 family [Acinetobacter sp. F_3_1]MCT8101560.1 phage terminase small subunit P27 family [Acinetobacter sp. C_4_1]MCT8135105.1 phage terminase small subunit P27 family [Acinetobacter sp. T_3_1]
MGGVNAVAGAGRKPKVKPAASNDFDGIIDIDAPVYMENMKHAVVIWKSIIPELLKRKTLTLTDMHNVEMFCIAYHNMRLAQEDIVLNGITVATAMGVSKNPAATVLNEASKQMASYGAMLGLDPASRNRLTGGGGKPKKNAFSEVLNM